MPESDHLKMELDEIKSCYELISVILKHDALETDNKQTPDIKNTDNNTMLNVRMCQYECVPGVSGIHNNTKLDMIRYMPENNHDMLFDVPSNHNVRTSDTLDKIPSFSPNDETSH